MSISLFSFFFFRSGEQIFKKRYFKRKIQMSKSRCASNLNTEVYIFDDERQFSGFLQPLVPVAATFKRICRIWHTQVNRSQMFYTSQIPTNPAETLPVSQSSAPSVGQTLQTRTETPSSVCFWSLWVLNQPSDREGNGRVRSPPAPARFRRLGSHSCLLAANSASSANFDRKDRVM